MAKSTLERRLYLRHVSKIQVALNRYIKEKCFDTFGGSKTTIARIFSEKLLIDGKKYFAKGKNKNERLMDIANKLWGDATPDVKKQKGQKKEDRVNSAEFLRSYEWRKLRYQALLLHGRRCMCCGRTPDHGIVLHVDHIKPRRKHPELATDINNLQILCEECNHGKGNWDETDHRNTMTTRN